MGSRVGETHHDDGDDTLHHEVRSKDGHGRDSNLRDRDKVACQLAVVCRGLQTSRLTPDLAVPYLSKRRDAGDGGQHTTRTPPRRNNRNRLTKHRCLHEVRAKRARHQSQILRREGSPSRPSFSGRRVGASDLPSAHRPSPLPPLSHKFHTKTDPPHCCTSLCPQCTKPTMN